MPAETIERPKAAGGPAATELMVTGMDCSNCVRHVTDALQSVPGVHSAWVSLETKRAAVRWNPGAQPSADALFKAVSGAGYNASLAPAATPNSTDHGEHKMAGWEFTLWIGVLGTIPIMLGEWVFHVAMTPWFQWVAFVLASLVQVLAGAQFYRGAWNQLKVGRSNMDTLVALGSTTAYAYSTWALVTGRGGHVYFMESAAIITLISLGHWMESRVSLKASGALRQLLNLVPQTARRLEADNSETEVPASMLHVDDRIVLRPGDRVPTDAAVLEGESAVDESMLTGESIPVDKKPESALFAGTVNANGRLVARVTATGDATAVAHIIAAVQRAQTSRAGIQRLGDRVSSVFVPIVVGIAVIAALWWGLAPQSALHAHQAVAPYLWPATIPDGRTAAAFIIAAAVLIIACPCAMGLATPTAIMAGSNAAAQRGILVRDGVALEKAGTVTGVVFDKTGTLTLGKPDVAKVLELRGDLDVKTFAASLARNSNHPISQALAKIAEGQTLVSRWRELRGAGVEGFISIDGQEKRLIQGSIPWLRESGVDLAAGESFVHEWASQGATLAGLAAEGELLAVFAVRDTLKHGAAQVVADLQARGLKVYLLTGDNPVTAASVARQVGIAPDNVFAGVKPEQKAGFVERLQKSGERIAFVGDGINDAPALEQADLGVAVTRASDVAREAADIILLKSEIEAVPEALGLARATLRTIKQNLFWAFFYNAVGVPLAALGFLSPILCAAAMGVSDIIVIGNALRLRRWRLPARN
ncbi:MAG TPA: cation-translocating P-type ATPase [Verrucomicrobiae bacterium]|nr:cation-translocating P-type ATPase [Verrucomicrobiae bacterium]